MIRVLSIDGGGIRGIVPATILVALEQYIKEYSQDEEACLGQYFDLVAGTSTGSIITCLILAPTEEHGYGKYCAKDILNIYLTEGKTIFTRSTLHQFMSGKGLIGSKYSSVGIKKLCDKYFADLKLSQLLKPCLIPAYDMESSQSLFFNQKTGLRSFVKDFFVADILRGSTAAPTFFKPAKVLDSKKQTYTLIDGGVFANNPAMCAYVEACKLDLRTEMKDMMLLSLGTLTRERNYKYHEVRNWGVAKWAMPLINIFGTSASDTVDHQLKTLFKVSKQRVNYIRIDGDLTTLNVSSEMDNVTKKNIEALKQAGELLVTQHELILRQCAKRLVEENQARQTLEQHVHYRKCFKRK